MSHRYGHYVRILHWCSHQTITNALTRMDLTAAQGPIMGYLAHRPDPPCSRDIEEEFHLSHPTVSGLLSRLEKKGFIEFRPDANDRRCKRIYMLPRGRDCVCRIQGVIEETENRMVQDFTEEEKAQFHILLNRAIVNMGINPCHPIHKEEHDS